MARALRKVSQDYNWTIKRAHNDLHHNIITPQPRTPSPSSPDTKAVDLSVLPWDVSVRFSVGDSEGPIWKPAVEPPSMEIQDGL
jgi:hypothetical protein